MSTQRELSQSSVLVRTVTQWSTGPRYRRACQWNKTFIQTSSYPSYLFILATYTRSTRRLYSTRPHLILFWSSGLRHVVRSASPCKTSELFSESLRLFPKKQQTVFNNVKCEVRKFCKVLDNRGLILGNRTDATPLNPEPTELVKRPEHDCDHSAPYSAEV
jgi:hypothetical protein